MAPIVIVPAVWPVTLLEATPPEAVAAPRPVRVPAPEVLAKVTAVELSPVTRLSAASLTSAVSVRAAPEARLLVPLVIVRWSGAPGTIVNVVEPSARPVAVAPIVIAPATAPVTLSCATPFEVAAAPRPVTVPAPALLAKLIERPLSPGTRLPAASRTSAVRVRVAPEARSAVELVITTWVGEVAGTTSKVVVSPASPAAAAPIVIVPATCPVTETCATPLEAVAAASPLTVPAPDVLENVTEVELSLATRLPLASRTSAVSERVLPDARFAAELVIVRWSAAPGTIVNAVESEASPAAVAWMVIGPASCAVTLFDVTPELAVAEPRPVTVPAPPVLANVTEVELSPVTRLPAASRTSALTVRAPPAVRFAAELVKVRWSPGPGTTANVIASEVRSGAEAVIVTGPARTPETVFVATPAEADAVPRPPTEPEPAVCANVTVVVLSEVTVLPAASFTVAVTSRFEPEARSAVEPVTTIEAGTPGSIVKLVVSAFSPAAVA